MLRKILLRVVGMSDERIIPALLNAFFLGILFGILIGMCI